MLASFSVIRQQAKLLTKRVTIDNPVFKLHYRVTMLLLMGCTVLVTSRQYIGEHIKCVLGDPAPVPQHVLESFCFFTSTYTVVRHLNPDLVAAGFLPHPGIGPAVGHLGEEEQDRIIRHAYYQWVPFVLFAQALMFYLPYYVWKQAEGGRMKNLVAGLQTLSISEYTTSDIKLNDAAGTTVVGRTTARRRMRAARSSFLLRVHSMRPWSSWLICCELANALNLLLQVALTDMLLGGTFRELGAKVVQGNDDAVDGEMGGLDYLDVVFPKVTKCDFYKYGPSGTIQRHDALCVMALNIINEKIFVFLWFWYAILAICTTCALIYRLITLLLHSRSLRFNRLLFRFASPGPTDYWLTSIRLTRRMHFSDWLFLYYLAKNVEGFVFREFFLELAREMDEDGRIEDVGRKVSNGRLGLADVVKDSDENDDLLKTK